MNRKFLALLSIILIFGFGPASCSSDSDPVPMPDTPGDELITLVLDLSVNTGMPSSRMDEAASRSYHPGDERVASRASAGVDFEVATDAFEKVNTLRVIITRPSANNVVEHNFSTTYDDVWNTLDSQNFEVISGERKNVYLIVNESGLPEALQAQLRSIDEGAPLAVDLAALTIDVERGTKYIDNSATDKDKLPIPMTEFYELDVPHANASSLTVAEDGKKVWHPGYTLFVTRTATKFSFTVSRAAGEALSKGLQITGITFSGTDPKTGLDTDTGLDTKEYLFPRNTVYSPGKLVVPSTVNHEIISFVTPPATETYSYTFEPGNFGLIGTRNDMTALKNEYVPLDYFLESRLKEFYISITTRTPLTDNPDDDIITVWPAAKLPNLPSLPRNTHVKVAMTIKNGELSAVATVYPYTAVSLNPQFGFTPPESDRLTVAPTMDLVLNGPDGLLYPTFESSKGNTIQNLYWVSSNPSVVLLGNEVTDETDQTYKEPSDAIELSYLQMVGDQLKTVPVRIVAQAVGTAVVSAYTQSGLVASCRVTVKQVAE